MTVTAFAALRSCERLSKRASSAGAGSSILCTQHARAWQTEARAV